MSFINALLPYYYGGGSTPVSYPLVQASDLSISANTAKKIDSLSWTRGDGSYCLLLGKVGGAVDANPVDGTTYSWDLQYGLGSEIGTGNFVLYKGTANSIPFIISGLNPEDDLHLRVFEFNGTPGNEKYLSDTAINNPINQQTDSSYKTKILSYSPIAYWPLDETSGTTADNAEGTSALDAVYNNNVKLKNKIFKDGEYSSFLPTNSYINIYSSAFNSAFDGNEGGFMFWVKAADTATWTNGAVERFLMIYINDNNRIILEKNASNVFRVVRSGGGTTKIVNIDVSSSPSEWICVVATWSVSNDEFKVYLNGTQQGTTQTGIGTFTGALVSTSTVIGSSNSTGTGAQNVTNKALAHIALFDYALSSIQVSDISSTPYETFLTNVYTEWSIYDLLGIEGSTNTPFLFDVDNDGEVELVCNVGRQARFVCIKQNGTVIWDTTVSSTKSTPCRHPCLINGVYYFANKTGVACAINVYTGAVIWTYDFIATIGNPTVINFCDKGVVIAGNNKVLILNKDTGNPIGSPWPFTLPFSPAHEQVLGVGDVDEDGFDEIWANDNSGNYIVIDHDATTLYSGSSFNAHFDTIFIHDINEDGSVDLMCVKDEDNTTGGITEGDEIVLMNSSGSNIDSYQCPDHSPAIRYSSQFTNGGRVAYSIEGGIKNIGLLDKNLTEIWKVLISGDMDGSQLCIIDIDNDGKVELLFNTSEEIDGSIRVIDEDGNTKLFFESGGLALTDTVLEKGWAMPKKVPNFSTGQVLNVSNLVTWISIDDSTVHDKIYLHKWRLRTIPNI